MNIFKYKIQCINILNMYWYILMINITTHECSYRILLYNNIYVLCVYIPGAAFMLWTLYETCNKVTQYIMYMWVIETALMETKAILLHLYNIISTSKMGWCYRSECHLKRVSVHCLCVPWEGFLSLAVRLPAGPRGETTCLRWAPPCPDTQRPPALTWLSPRCKATVVQITASGIYSYVDGRCLLTHLKSCGVYYKSFACVFG